MSRPAPKTLSEDDRRTVGEVRKELWVQGFQGLAAGTVAGFVAHTSLAIGNRRDFWGKIKLNNNTRLLAVLLGGAIGSFIGASTAGKNEVHKMHPVFRKGQKTVGDIKSGIDANNGVEVVDDYRSAPTAADTPMAGAGSMYQQSLQRAKDREMDLQVLERRRTDRDSTSTSTPMESGRVEREQNRLYRRATIHRTMEAGTSGLSDAHGGHWGDGKKDGSEGK
jgi:hypothetical protein